MMHVPRRFWILVVMPTMLVIVGTLGYHWIEEKYTLLDGLYMTIITLTTIGYGEVHPLSDKGKIFTILLILGGVFAFIYSATEMIRGVVSGEFAEIYGKQKMARDLAKLEGHIIVCGYGRMGRLVCKEFSRLHRAHVVIDSSQEELKEFP